MGTFLDALWQHRAPLGLVIVLLLATAAIIHWIAWVFRIGRFASRSAPQGASPLRYVAANFFVEIINDFRHLLALVVVLLFALALFLAMYPGLRARDVGTMADGVQAVAAALGGLIGSIIGYYFGESAATRRDVASAERIRDSSAPVQAAAEQGSTGDIVAAPGLPGAAAPSSTERP